MRFRVRFACEAIDDARAMLKADGVELIEGKGARGEYAGGARVDTRWAIVDAESARDARIRLERLLPACFVHDGEPID
jgi:hypothetical protein